MSRSMVPVVAIVVAGGASRRFGSKTLKQFTPLLGRPLLAHTLAQVARCHSIGPVVLVLPCDGFEESLATIEPFVSSAATTFVAGGKTRQDSVWAGLSSIANRLQDTPDALVVVHDGARPLADAELIERVIGAAAESGAAIAAAPIVETLKEVGSDLLVERTVDRERFYRAQTPQCFRYDILRDAFEAAQRDGVVGTDEAALVERGSATIRIVPGNERNIKVTTFEDLARVEYFLNRGAK